MQTMFIMRGAPGSGKSTVAQTIAYGCDPKKVTICSTDTFHYEWQGNSLVYAFKPEKAAEFHRKNQDRAKECLSLGHTVIIDNTNIRVWEAAPYVKMAVDRGIPIVFVECTGRFPNLHGVPEERVNTMRDSMEDLTIEGCLQAWEARQQAADARAQHEA